MVKLLRLLLEAHSNRHNCLVTDSSSCVHCMYQDSQMLLHFAAFSIFSGSSKGKPSLKMVPSNVEFSEQLRKAKTCTGNATSNSTVTGATIEQV